MHDKHFNFHKVVYRYYSGEVETANITLQQIYSGNYVPNFIRIARVLSEILHKTFWSLFSGHSVFIFIVVMCFRRYLRTRYNVERDLSLIHI